MKGGCSMKAFDGKVFFTPSDSHFLKRFGMQTATEMVLDYCTLNSTPFIYDTYQLSNLLGIERKLMFKLLRTGDECNYRLITVKKKNGKLRLLQAPLEPLKSCQKRILTNILSSIPVSRYATAYKRGVTLCDNASPHIGKKYILKTDITDFFGSIRFEQVYSAAFNTRYYPKQIGVILTSLCCFEGALPQGAPTSPALSNLVLKNFDDNIGSWCEKRGITYTRYCDDMTFSSDKPLHFVLPRIKDMLDNMGFEINQEKTRIITSCSRQSVTGLTVNEGLFVPRDYKRRLRQEIYYCIKHGPANCLLKLNDPEYLTGGELEPLKYLDILQGRINFVLSVEPDNEYFKNSLTKIRELRLKYLDGQTDYIPYYI